MRNKKVYNTETRPKSKAPQPTTSNECPTEHNGTDPRLQDIEEMKSDDVKQTSHDLILATTSDEQQSSGQSEEKRKRGRCQFYKHS